ncbi:MAG: hypothetical protein KTR16_08665 [Acidiferrobacterales bacterium]|nr:hypothetical protein [Acidiferrobacterales bacterium]
MNSAILLAEDDPDQKALLVDIVMSQVKRVLGDKNLSEQQRETLVNIQLISVTSIDSLKQAVKKHKNILLAILDCNMPDAEGEASHDQFIKTNHRITGQHTAVDIVLKYIPDTPVTMISSQNRFQKIISRYYKSKLDKDINFINKNDPATIRRNVRYYLAQFIK